jgi:hypothetical protein
VHKHCFFFSLVWSVGASCDLRGRGKFDEFIRGLAEEYGHTACLPKEGSIYGSCLLSDFRAWDWTQWMDTIPAFKLDPKTPFGSILVPTVDTVRYSHVLAILVTCDKHVLCVGNTGDARRALFPCHLFPPPRIRGQHYPSPATRRIQRPVYLTFGQRCPRFTDPRSLVIAAQAPGKP